MTDTDKIGADRNAAEREQTDYDVDQLYQNLVIAYSGERDRSFR